MKLYTPGQAQAKILVVDDEQTVVMHLREVLKSFGHQPIVTTNPEMVQEILSNESVDLILLDFHIGSVSGLDVLKTLRSDLKHQVIPVIFLTGETDETTLGRCFDAGAADYLNKPIKTIELKARINSCLQIRQERQKYQQLLQHVLPKEVSDELMVKGDSTPRYHDQITVGFTDFTNFTNVVSDWPPEKVVEALHRYFIQFDTIINRHNLTTVKTIGDAYMFAGGLFEDYNCHAVNCLNAALEIRDCMHQSAEELQLPHCDWDIRIGLNTGPAVSGVISGNKLAHDLWGDTVNTAQRMESHSIPGKIQISNTTFAHLPSDKLLTAEKNTISVKGKGEMETYLIH